MKIVIDIPEEYYNAIESANWSAYNLLEKDWLIRAVHYGTTLPKGHGRLVDADAIPNQVELKGLLSQDDMHLVTIDRVKAALNEAPTIIEADKES